MIRVLRRLQLDVSNVCQIRASGLLIDGTHIHARVLSRAVDSVDVYNWKWLEQDLCFRLDQLASASVPARSLKEEAIHVHALRRGLVDVILIMACDFIVQVHGVERPAAVRARHFL